MQRIPSSPPTIAPISATNRPLWSVMIPVYNGGVYLAKTIESVLAEGISADQMQIEVVDDASNNADIKAIVNAAGKDRVSYFRREVNVGPLRNFETCINRSRGQFIHLLHQDDLVKPGYYKKMMELFDKFPQIGAAFSDYDYVNDKGDVISRVSSLKDSEGILENWLDRIVERNRLQYVCISIKRKVYETIGSYYLVTYGEDWEMWARIAKNFPVAYTPQILTAFRMHETSQTGSATLNGAFLKDCKKVINVIAGYVDVEKRKEKKQVASKEIITFGWHKTLDVWNSTHNGKAVRANLHQLLKFPVDLKMFISISFLYLRTLKLHFKKK